MTTNKPFSNVPAHTYADIYNCFKCSGAVYVLSDDGVVEPSFQMLCPHCNRRNTFNHREQIISLKTKTNKMVEQLDKLNILLAEKIN